MVVDVPPAGARGALAVTAPGGGLRIRGAHQTDLAAIGAVLEASYRGLVTDDYVAWMANPQRWWRGATAVFVAQVEGVVVGTVTLALPDRAMFPSRAPAHSDATFRLLGVRDEARGRGFGTALVRTCIDTARARGARRIAIHTVDTMAAARRLYADLGFTRRPDLDVTYPGGVGLGYALDLTDDASTHFPPPGPIPDRPPWHEDVHGPGQVGPKKPPAEGEG